MILSASRRTDIPAFYGDWFVRRLQEGFLCVRNPMNRSQVSRIALSPETVDCIVFWTKNPVPMFSHLKELEPYPYCFQYTITGYGHEIEPGLPDKQKVLVPAFIRLAEEIGQDRMIWRYDPIFLSDRYTPEYHERAFSIMAELLEGSTRRVVISFLDEYEKTKRNMRGYHQYSLTEKEMREMASRLAPVAARHGMEIVTCAEKTDLEEYGIRHGSCIDREFLEHILGCRLRGRKDHGQRGECGCMESVEVGAYHTCGNGCRYCYANFSEEKVRRSVREYDANSPLLCDRIRPGDEIKERKMDSLKESQMCLEDFLLDNIDTR